MARTGQIGSSIRIRHRFPVISAIVMFATAGYLGMNLLVDILYGVLDPRIRQS